MWSFGSFKTPFIATINYWGETKLQIWNIRPPTKPFIENIACGNDFVDKWLFGGEGGGTPQIWSLVPPPTLPPNSRLVQQQICGDGPQSKIWSCVPRKVVCCNNQLFGGPTPQIWSIGPPLKQPIVENIVCWKVFCWDTVCWKCNLLKYRARQETCSDPLLSHSLLPVLATIAKTYANTVSYICLDGYPAASANLQISIDWG